MIPDILEIENGRVVVNVNVLTIPALKAVHDEYQDPIPALCYLYYKFAVKGPYCNTPEADIDDVLLTDFPGEYTLEDQAIIDAVKFLTERYVTPTQQYYLDNKCLLEKLGAFARTTSITAGRDGNIMALSQQVRNVGKTITEFKILEKSVLEELAEAKGRTRGDKKLAYDQE